jgi:2-hydroxy-3-keto-5-methylthiopentenyl-1-phosphate phosphatase
VFLEETVHFRQGLEELLESWTRDGGRVLIASGGFDFYIHRILQRPAVRRFDLSVLSSHGEVKDGGIEVSFPYLETMGCPKCTLCKGRLLWSLRKGEQKIVFCGDGLSDRCAIAACDVLFCVGGSSLHDHARAAQVPHEPFGTFDEVGFALGL